MLLVIFLRIPRTAEFILRCRDRDIHNYIVHCWIFNDHIVYMGGEMCCAMWKNIKVS